MKKYFLKDDGKEIKVGDIISVVEKSSSPTVECTVVGTFTITEEILPMLIQSGIIVVGKDKSKKEVPLDLLYYVSKLGRKQGWSTSKTLRYLTVTDNIYTAAMFSILLKEIAIELDKKYSDHIRNSEEIYAVSVIDGNIYKVESGNINFRNFAAFRSKEDAATACTILKRYTDKMFNSDDK